MSSMRRWSAAIPTPPRKLKFNEALKRIIDRLATDLIEHTRCEAEASGVRSVEEVRTLSRRLAAFSAGRRPAKRGAEAFPARACLFASGDCGRARTLRGGAGRAVSISSSRIPSECPGLRRAGTQRTAAPGGVRLHRRDDRSFSAAPVRRATGQAGQEGRRRAKVIVALASIRGSAGRLP